MVISFGLCRQFLFLCYEFELIFKKAKFQDYIKISFIKTNFDTSDILDTIKVAKYKYFFTIVDHLSKFSYVYPLKKKIRKSIQNIYFK